MEGTTPVCFESIFSPTPPASMNSALEAGPQFRLRSGDKLAAPDASARGRGHGRRSRLPERASLLAGGRRHRRRARQRDAAWRVMARSGARDSDGHRRNRAGAAGHTWRQPRLPRGRAPRTAARLDPARPGRAQSAREQERRRGSGAHVARILPEVAELLHTTESPRRHRRRAWACRRPAAKAAARARVRPRATQVRSMRTARDDDEVPRYALLRRVRPELLQGALVVLLCLMLVSSGTALVSMALWRGPLPQSTSQPGPARRPPMATRDGATTQNGASKGPDAPARRRTRRVLWRGASAPGRSRPQQHQRRSRAVPPSTQDRLPAVAPRSSPSNAVPSPDAGRDRFWSVTVREVRPEATFAGAGGGLTCLSS